MNELPETPSVQSGAAVGSSALVRRFIVSRSQYPEWLSGWNELGPCWTSSDLEAYQVKAEDLARVLCQLADKSGRLGGGENLTAHLSPNDPR